MNATPRVVVDVPTAPEVARTVADALEAAEVPYAIGGAIAYALHGPPRATNDVDVNVFVTAERVDEALDALAPVATFDRDEARHSARRRDDFQVEVAGMRVDVFLSSVELSDSARERTRDAILLGRPIKILAAEDLIVFKLIFFRSKDLADAERLVAFMGPDLDRTYVRRWLVEMVGSGDRRIRTWDDITSRHA